VALATVQRISQKHGGRIWVEAELDQGACLYFAIGAPGNLLTVAQPLAAMAGGDA
jgi:signal transduction histidine kinase